MDSIRKVIRVINALDTEADRVEAGWAYYGVAATPEQMRQWSQELEAEITFSPEGGSAMAITPKGAALAEALLREQFTGWKLTAEGWDRRPDTTYRATKRWENGRQDVQEFTDYAEMCRWLAEDPEAGIGAIKTDDEGEETYVDPLQLADDVQAYL